MGASLSVSTIMSVGKMTFFAMIFTFAMCFGGGYFIRKLFGFNWKLSNLISAGIGIWCMTLCNKKQKAPVKVAE